MTTTEPDLVDLAREEQAAPLPPPAAPRWRFRWTRRMTGFTLLGFGLFLLGFLLFEFVVSGLVADRSQRELTEEFRELSSLGPATTTDWQPNPGDPIAVLTIPRLGVEVVVVEGTTSQLTAEGPGHFRGSPLPGRPGTSIIAGRRSTFGAPMRGLDTIQKGDLLTFATGVGQFTYVVDAPPKAIRPGDDDVFAAPGGTSRVTLITSDPTFTAQGRLVVTAAIRGLPAAEPLRPVTLVSPAELGLAGEGAAVPGLVVWGELLILSIVAMAYVRARISRRIGWLLGMPLIIAFTWATYLSLNRVLPSTL